MENKYLKKVFRESELVISIDKERKEKTLNLLSEEINRTKNIFLYDKKKIIKNQFIYMDKTVLLGNIAGRFIMVAFAFIFYNFRLNNREVITLYSILASIISVLSLAGISKMFSSSNSELEGSCYFNTKQMITLQMVFSGIINLAVLLMVTIILGYKMQMAFVQLGLYVFVPYVFTQCCCLCTFLTKTGRQSSYILFGVGLFTCVIFSMVAIIPKVYLMSAMIFWVIAFIVGVLMLSIQIKIFFHEIEKGELLCMN